VQGKSYTDWIKDIVRFEGARPEIGKGFFDPPVIPEIDPRVSTVFTHMMGVDVPGQGIGK
jgi:hypothetical protein